MSFLLRISRSLPRTTHTAQSCTIRHFSSTPAPLIKVDRPFISSITAAEKKLTNSDEPLKGGPTAKAQAHYGQELTSNVVSKITAGEKLITDSDEPVPGGPTSVAQSALTAANESEGSNNATSPRQGKTQNQNQNQTQNAQHTGKLDSATISKITDAEKKITGEDGAVSGGPTAKAQKHANETITSEVLSDITEGEKNVTGGERVKGGPTSTAQSELAKSRQE